MKRSDKEFVGITPETLNTTFMKGTLTIFAFLIFISANSQTNKMIDNSTLELPKIDFDEGGELIIKASLS
jgi:hypothetical protein